MSLATLSVALLAGVSCSSGNGSDDGTLTLAGAALPHSHTHTRHEIDENHGALMLELTYIGDLTSSASGGIASGTRYLDNLELVFEADLEKTVGWRGAELHLSGLYNNGQSLSDLTGDALIASNIETGTSAIRLYQAWIDQAIGNDLSIRIGLYDLNSEFDVLETSGLFIGSAHGMGADIAQTGENGPSIFPVTSLAVRLEKAFAGNAIVRAAILDAVPGDPEDPSRTLIRIGREEGALAIAELELPLGNSGRLLAGHWRYTSAFNDFNDIPAKGNSGSYVRGEARLYRNESREVDAFFRLGQASGRFNMFGTFASAGLKVAAAEAGELGLAIATAWTSDAYRDASGAGRGETVYELTYRKDVLPSLSLQPSLQYVRSPSAHPGVGNALVVGLRAEVSFRYEYN